MIKLEFRSKHLKRCYEDGKYGNMKLGKLHLKYIKRIDMLKTLDSFNDLFTQFASCRPHKVSESMTSVDLDGNNRLWFSYREEGSIEILKIEWIGDPHGKRS